MNADSERKRDASRSEHQQQQQHNSKRSNSGSLPHQMHPPGLFMQGDISPSQFALASALAMASGGVGGGMIRPSPFLGAQGPGTPTPPPPQSPQQSVDNSNFLALYQSQVWQAAIRHNQMQLINQLSSLGHPFMSPQGPPPPPNLPFPSLPLPPSLEAANAYREYINKYAKAQQSSTAATTSSPTTSSARSHTSTSSTTTTSSAQAAVAAQFAASLMAAAGKPTSSSSDYVSSISTTSNLRNAAPDSRSGSQAVRYGMDKHDPMLSPNSMLSGGMVERKDNNNGKHLHLQDRMRNESPPTIPTSIAPIAQSIIGTGRGSGHRTSSGRGRGRGASHTNNSSDPNALNGRDKVYKVLLGN